MAKAISAGWTPARLSAGEQSTGIDLDAGELPGVEAADLAVPLLVEGRVGAGGAAEDLVEVGADGGAFLGREGAAQQDDALPLPGLDVGLGEPLLGLNGGRVIHGPQAWAKASWIATAAARPPKPRLSGRPIN